jgi:hypothetical protein
MSLSRSPFVGGQGSLCLGERSAMTAPFCLPLPLGASSGEPVPAPPMAARTMVGPWLGSSPPWRAKPPEREPRLNGAQSGGHGGAVAGVEPALAGQAPGPGATAEWRRSRGLVLRGPWLGSSPPWRAKPPEQEPPLNGAQSGGHGGAVAGVEPALAGQAPGTGATAEWRRSRGLVLRGPWLGSSPPWRAKPPEPEPPLNGAEAGGHGGAVAGVEPALAGEAPGTGATAEWRRSRGLVLRGPWLESSPPWRAKPPEQEPRLNGAEAGGSSFGLRGPWLGSSPPWRAKPPEQEPRLNGAEAGGSSFGLRPPAPRHSHTLDGPLYRRTRSDGRGLARGASPHPRSPWLLAPLRRGLARQGGRDPSHP